jgi:hypothetical protein
VIGIDEDTAIVDLSGGGRSWQVHGRQQAWILAAGQDHGTGQRDSAGEDSADKDRAGQPYPAGTNIKVDLYK